MILPQGQAPYFARMAQHLDLLTPVAAPSDGVIAGMPPVPTAIPLRLPARRAAANFDKGGFSILP